MPFTRITTFAIILASTRGCLLPSGSNCFGPYLFASAIPSGPTMSLPVASLALGETHPHDLIIIVDNARRLLRGIRTFGLNNVLGDLIIAIIYFYLSNIWCD